MGELLKSHKKTSRMAVVISTNPKRGHQSAPRRTAHVAVKSDAKFFQAWSDPNQALKLFRAGVMDRVNMVKEGVPALYVNVLTTSMGIPKDKFYRTIGLMRPTVDRKVRESKRLNQDESERVLGIARLIGEAQSLVQESGESRDFDAARWLGVWLDQPLRALGGKSPGEYMDTADGRSLVSDLLAQQQSGAYA